ncbi:MAG TPA: HPr family phosphocarrier protein, partial [Actinotalea sp.]|nr:HPr family phosphocarrier protein [Actinotalea sp.]
SVDRVMAAVEQGLAACGRDGGGVVVLTDLGSAILTTDLVLEMIDEDDAARVRVPSAPIVEGSVAAAVRAQQGGDLDAVEAAAVEALRPGGPVPEARAVGPDGPPPDGAVLTATAVLRNPLGLHARPAATLARAVAETGVPVLVDGVDGGSILALMSLGARGGHALSVSASGPGARAAVERVVGVIEEGFGEA